jgi:hypothetical protein
MTFFIPFTFKEIFVMTASKYCKILPLLVLSLASIGTANASSTDEPTLVEVPVRRVFFPAQGYDNNDNIQIVIEGDVPDPCFVLGNPTVSRDAAGVITVHQFAWRRHNDVCNEGDLLGESPYSEEVSLGMLKAGDYRIAFSPDDDKTDYRKLHVEVAPVRTTDNFNYARVTSLQVRDVILEGDSVMVTLGGPFTESCNHLKEPVAFERLGDTIVIRPIELNLGDCGWSLHYFEKKIDLGVLPPGEYLVHVRSRNGKVIEKTFRVIHVQP